MVTVISSIQSQVSRELHLYVIMAFHDNFDFVLLLCMGLQNLRVRLPIILLNLDLRSMLRLLMMSLLNDHHRLLILNFLTNVVCVISVILYLVFLIMGQVHEDY